MATNPPQPPRMTGDPDKDALSLNQWVWAFYEKVVLSNLYLQQEGQFDSDFDLSTLPDPATSTIATAQDTANNAYVLAATAQTAADAAQDDADTAVTAAGTAQTAAEAAQADADTLTALLMSGFMDRSQFQIRIRLDLLLCPLTSLTRIIWLSLGSEPLLGQGYQQSAF